MAILANFVSIVVMRVIKFSVTNRHKVVLFHGEKKFQYAKRLIREITFNDINYLIIVRGFWIPALQQGPMNSSLSVCLTVFLSTRNTPFLESSHNFFQILCMILENPSD